MCNNWPDFPISVQQGATGGLIENTVIICGGSISLTDSFDECYSLTSEKAALVTHMSVGRQFAASIVLNDNTLWVTGGVDYATMGNVWDLASTEYVKMTGTMLGPDLPIALSDHAIVAINSTCSMVIGGDSHSGVYSASTFFYDHNEGEWINGPSLMQARGGHAAGIVTDEVTNEHFVAVTGGFYFSYYIGSLDYTEILQNGEWVEGNNILSSGHFLVQKTLRI